MRARLGENLLQSSSRLPGGRKQHATVRSEAEGLPWWGPVAEAPRCQCRGPGFDPWSGSYIPYAATKTWQSQINKNTKKKGGETVFL